MFYRENNEENKNKQIQGVEKVSIENSIKDVITQKLEDGMIEKLIAEQLENGVKNALKDLLGSYGDVTKIIKDKVKSVMIPYLESYDYSEYITKLDNVLVEVLQNTTVDNKKLLTNFKELMIEDKMETVKVTELFDIWIKRVAKNVETDGLEIDYDDEPSYECVNVRFEVQEDEGRDWSSFKYATLFFECDHDKEMNFAIRLSRYTKSSREGWNIEYKRTHEISSLRYINEFEVLLMKLTQNGTRLILDSEWEEDEVRPEKEPEVSFS